MLPLLQHSFSIFKIRGLQGSFEKTPDVQFKIDSLFTTGYQERKEKFLTENFGFRNDAIRVNNQISYSLFNIAPAHSCIIGKNDYLYEENYIKAYLGLDFVGEDSIAHRVQKLKFVQDTLAKMGKTLLFVFAPGKASFYPEYIPSPYDTIKPQITNYQCYLKNIKKQQINHVDFMHYFLENKNKSKYPLYPKYGIHWSYYGYCFASDSLVKYFENKLNIDMPNQIWNNIETEYAHGNDVDICRGFNLLFDTQFELMAYPDITVESKKGKKTPNLLTIGDSFHWCLADNGKLLESFNNFEFLYYNREFYTSKFIKVKRNEINLKERIEHNDIIMLIMTDANLSRAGWNFVEECYKLYR